MLIVDVGGGNHPFPLANIVVERYPGDNAHRAHREPCILYPWQRMIVADVAHLPFRDKSVEFIWCTHVLEHVDDPVGACKELQRVAMCGHIATPAPMYEFWASEQDPTGWETHRWVCYKEFHEDLKNDGLTFWAKPETCEWPFMIKSSTESVLDWADEFRSQVLTTEEIVREGLSA